MFTFGHNPFKSELDLTSNDANELISLRLESSAIQHTIHYNSEHHSSGYHSHVDTIVRPGSTEYDPLNQRLESIERIDGHHIEPEVVRQYVAVQNERAASEQSERNTVNMSENNVHSALDAGLQKKVLPRKNKNQTPRLSRLSLYNNQNNRKMCVKEHPNELLNKLAECHMNENQRLPITNNLEQENEGYSDFVIHNSGTDFEAAKNFRQQLLNLGIPTLTVDIFELIDPGKTEMESINMLHEQYKTVLLFITQSYSEDKLRRHQAEIMLHKRFETEALGHWVVPVWIEKDTKMPELAPIKGIKYHLLKQNKEELLKQVTDLVIDGRKR